MWIRFFTNIVSRHSGRLRRRVTALTMVGILVASSAFTQEADRQKDAHRRDANPVIYWNAIADAAFTPSQGTNPMAQSRTLAILHAAIHDAVNAIEPRFESYTPGLASLPGASVEAAVAGTAREVLVTLLPEQATLVEAAYSQTMAAIPDGAAKAAGISLGVGAARATLARRTGDGSETGAQPVYVPRPGPGEYQFTPPFDFAAQPGWGHVKPFVIDLREHVLEGPLPLSSPKYARDLAHVKAIGGINSTTRTPEQSAIAQFWYEDSPLGWNRIANIVVRQRRLDTWDAARTFALVNFAMADGFTAGFEAKYRFRFWRPETAIHEAATDGSPLTQPEITWRPLLITPPVPDFPSTHTVLGWAAAEVLIELLGAEVRFSVTSLTLPGVRRHFKRFADAAEENGLSRLYAGIHFPYAIREGRRQGRSIGQAVAGALKPLR